MHHKKNESTDEKNISALILAPLKWHLFLLLLLHFISSLLLSELTHGIIKIKNKYNMSRALTNHNLTHAWK